MEYLVTEAFTKAKKEKRKTVYYRDLGKKKKWLTSKRGDRLINTFHTMIAGTVKEIEQFEFLEDVIPTTMTLKAAIEKRKETLHEDTPLVSSPPSKKQKTDEEEEEEEEEEEVIETQDDDEEMEEPKVE